jgi:hypothetical protein
VSINHYCDMWYWRASDQEAVARHLRDHCRTIGVPDTPPRAGPVRLALLSVLRITGLAEQPFEARPVEQEEAPAREGCGCGGEEEFQQRKAVLHDGEWVLRCPECGHLDRLLWLSEESRVLLVGLARRRRRVRVRRTWRGRRRGRCPRARRPVDRVCRPALPQSGTLWWRGRRAE